MTTQTHYVRTPFPTTGSPSVSADQLRFRRGTHPYPRGTRHGAGVHADAGRLSLRPSVPSAPSVVRSA